MGRIPGIWAQFGADGRSLFTFGADEIWRYELKPENLGGEWMAGEVFFKGERGDGLNAGTLSADGRTLAVGAVNRVLLLDVASRTIRKHFKVYTHNAELSPDGEVLATRFHNTFGILRDASSGMVLTQMTGVVEFVFSPDNQWILAKGVDKLRLLDRKMTVVREIPMEVGAGFPPSAEFSPDGTMLAVVHNRFDVQLLDVASGRALATFVAPRRAQAMWSRGLAFSKDGQTLALAKENGEVVSWHLPVVRKELSAMGLDWGKEEEVATQVTSTAPQALRNGDERDGANEHGDGIVMKASTATALPFVGSPALTTAFCAVALALAAGLFVSLHQRRMLSAYVRAEALTAEQQRKLQMAQEELQHSQKMRALGTLAAGVAHDFNNLLSVIRLSNQLAAEQTRANGTAKENMEAIEAAVGQGEVIVQSMLGYSRAAVELENEYSVSAAISETVAMLGRKFLSGIVLQLEVEPGIPMAGGVRGRLEQMLLNLVVNASEAMNGRGTLRLAARVVDDAGNCILRPNDASHYVEVCVGDSGPGIPAEILPRIFEPFFTTKSAGARPGTGLGLSTVYMMAQQDGLGLAVETGAGAGTVFRILIPIMNSVAASRVGAAGTERNKPSAPPTSGH